MHAGEVWTKLNVPNNTIFWTSDKKWLIIFDKALTSFWKSFLQLKHLFDAKLFQCYKNYGSPLHM